MISRSESGYQIRFIEHNSKYLGWGALGKHFSCAGYLIKWQPNLLKNRENVFIFTINNLTNTVHYYITALGCWSRGSNNSTESVWTQSMINQLSNQLIDWF